MRVHLTSRRQWHVALLISLLIVAACTGDRTPTGVERDALEVTAQSSVRREAALAAQSGRQRYIVALKKNVRDPHQLASQLVSRHNGRLRFVYSRAMKGFAADLPPAAASALRTNPNVAYVEADSVQLVLATTQSPTPNWGLDRIDTRAPYYDNKYFYDRTGAGVHLYSFDTGVNLSHIELTGRLASGIDIISPGGNADDCNGHGTHTTTIATGTTYGVAKQMTVHPVRVVDCSGSGSPSQFVAGVDSALAYLTLPAVANISLGYGPSPSVDAAVNSLIASGVLVAVAAGNDGVDACNQSPARVPDAVTVAATDHSDQRAIFNPFESSNYGSCVDIFAPGKDITAGWVGSPSATNTLSGTSMAAPHVAGTIGLYLQGFPSSTPSQAVSKLLTMATENEVSNPGPGTPNRLLFMRYALMTPTADFDYNCGTHYCDLYGYPSIDDFGITDYTWWIDDPNAYPQRPSGETVHVDFFSAGGYQVDIHLTVRDADGRTHTTVKSVYIT